MLATTWVNVALRNGSMGVVIRLGFKASNTDLTIPGILTPLLSLPFSICVVPWIIRKFGDYTNVTVAMVVGSVLATTAGS